MGNVYMEADQVRFKNSTYHNLQTAVSAALEGGGGGGTTVIANPEGSATADLAKLQVGTTIYGIPAEAGDISYDNTSSGMTADDVQEAIDELSTGISGISELIPSDATSSNKLATAGDIPGVATTSAPGIVQPDGTTITINNGVISAPEGGVPVPGTTSVPAITWIRRGALVLVSCYGVDFTSQSSITVTGLPAPVNGAYVLQALMHNEYVGNIQYTNNSWVASLKSTNDKLGYAGFVYLAADN